MLLEKEKKTGKIKKRPEGKPAIKMNPTIRLSAQLCAWVIRIGLLLSASFKLFMCRI